MFLANNRLCTIVVALLVLPLAAGSAAAATYYVSNSGNDGAAGSQAAPWRTLQHAANSVTAGDVVLVADGTYAGFNMTTGGTAGARIVFRADGNNVLINSSNPSTADCINIEGADYVTVDGFDVEDAGRAGIRVALSRGVIVQNNNVQRGATWGIFTAYTPEVEIINNVCAAAISQHGIYVSNSSVSPDSPVLRGNECYGNAKNGIQLNGDCMAGGDGVIDNALIEDNILHDNGWKGLSLISVTGSLIQNNVIYNNGAAGAGAGGIHFADEPGCGNPSSNNVAVNNTVVENSIAAMRLSGGSTNNVVFNNIAISDNLADTINDEVGGNTIDGLSNLRAISTAGLFENVGAGNYHLASGSSAIDGGTATLASAQAPGTDIEGNTRPAGDDYDIGAYEGAGGTSPPPPPPPVPGDIYASHPRIFFGDPATLTRVRGVACIDDNGNYIPGCTQSLQWNEFQSLLDNYPDNATAFDYALAYMVTQNQSYASTAIQRMESMYSGGWDAVRSENYRFLYVRDYLREMACAYDWLYDRLTSDQRTRFRNYMLMLVYISWNDDAVCDAIYNVGGWGTSDPGNNFYYNFVLATAYAGLALYGEDVSTFTWAGNTYPYKIPFAGTDYTDMIQFVYDKFDQEAIPDWLNTHGRGGGWHEGNQYGPSSKRHMFEALLVLKLAGGEDYFDGVKTTFPEEAAYYHIYATQPGRGSTMLYNGGDAGREPTMATYDYDRHNMLALVWGLEGTIASQYAQYWVKYIKPTMGLKAMRGLDFLLFRPDLPERAFTDLPLAYNAEGLGWFNSRSSWADDAVSISFISTDKITGHQHSDQNAIQFYRGTNDSPVNGWLVTDVQPFAQSLRRSTNYHNTIVVNGEDCQRYGMGTGSMPKFESAPDYAYAVGDASDAYYTDQLSPCNSTSGTKQLNVFQRELVHLRPGYVVMFDRITPVSSGANIESMFHYHNDPTVTGDEIVTANGGGKVFQKVLLPVNPVLSEFNEQLEDTRRLETWRVELRDYSGLPNRQHLNVFYITDESTLNMPNVVNVDSQDNKMTGAKLDHGGEDVILFFSTDPTGESPVGDIIYEVGLRLDSIHYLFDLLPSTQYNIAYSEDNGVYTVRVSRGDGVRTSPEGVLRFEIHSPPSVVRN